MTQPEAAPPALDIDVSTLREAISEEYTTVAEDPGRGFHFHTGRRLAGLLGYTGEWLEGIPETAIESLAGTGNPFSMGEPKSGERVVDIGSGSGLDSLIAGRMVGPEGRVIGVDMTQAMLDKAHSAAVESGLENIEFKKGHAESLPVPDGWADVVISNGVLNLVPDKRAAVQEMARVLRPTGRLQIGDILVEREVPLEGKQNIDLWTG